MTGQYHLFVYVCPHGIVNDASFQVMRPLIEPYIPIVAVAANAIVAFRDALIRYKKIYEEVKEGSKLPRREPPTGSPDQIEPQKKELFGALHITDWHSEYLYTLIRFDDISDSPLFKQEESYCCQLLRRTRQLKVTVFILIQNWKGLSPSVKNEITTLFLFKGFNQQQLNYIYTPSSVLERPQFLTLMNSLTQKEGIFCIRIDTDSGELTLLNLRD